MKKVLASAFLAAVVIVSSLTVAHADLITDVLKQAIKAVFTVETVGAGEDEFLAACNELDTFWRSSPNGVVKVSYDVLSSAAMELNSNRAPCALQQFSVGSVTGYFIRGTGRISISDGGTYDISKRCFCDGSGAAYYAEAPAPGTVTPTPGPDYSDELSKINNNLDMLPIMAEIMIEIANTQLDTWDWYKIIVREIWDIGDTLDGLVYNISYGSSLLSAINVRLSNLYSYMVDVNARVTKISERLESVIVDNRLQVNTIPIEARLDKLISMYSKVNSVVLDTASVNRGYITGAVGGELQDVVFWGDTLKYNNEFLTPGSLTYRLGPNSTDNTRHVIDDSIVLRSVNLGSTIPSYIANDPVLYAGVWRKGTDYIISDTYNASTGEYVQRVRSRTFDGSENWWSAQFSSDSRFNLFFLEYSSADDWYFIAENSTHFNHLPVMEFDNDIACLFSNYAAGISDSSITSRYMSEVPYILNGNGFWRVLSYQKYTLDSWKALLSDMSSAGSPFTVLYVPYSAVQSPTVRYFDPSTIAIQEGNSYISSYNVRITGKYETFDSYTQTADIINAINNLQLSSGVGADLTAITTRLDTLINKTSDTVVNVVNNNTYITNVFQLDDDTSVVDTTKDGVGKVSGLFKWLWNNTFKSAFAHADITKLDGLL